MSQQLRSAPDLEQILGREVDLISYWGLTPTTDDDIRRDAVLL